MIEVMSFNEFGICPRCGQLMGMLQSRYTMYGLTPHGHYPNRLLHEETDITYACMCGYKCQMVMTPAGIYPKNYIDLDKVMNTKVDRKLAKVIGYVERKKKK